MYIHIPRNPSFFLSCFCVSFNHQLCQIPFHLHRDVVQISRSPSQSHVKSPDPLSALIRYMLPWQNVFVFTDPPRPFIVILAV